jgi:hypothetical protein
MNLRDLFIAAKTMIAPTPEAELPMMRHDPMEGNDDLQFWDDMKYLHELRSEIFDEIRDGGFVWELPVPVESPTVWAELQNSLDADIAGFAAIFEDVA